MRRLHGVLPPPVPAGERVRRWRSAAPSLVWVKGVVEGHPAAGYLDPRAAQEGLRRHVVGRLPLELPVVDGVDGEEAAWPERCLRRRVPPAARGEIPSRSR